MDLRTIDDVLQRQSTPLVRTWFADDAAWDDVVSATLSPGRVGDDQAPNVTPIDDSAFAGISAEDMLDAIGERPGLYVLLADHLSPSAGEEGATVVYLNLDGEDPVQFRCVSSWVAEIEANLSIANMDFADYADAVDEDGVFRGF